MSERDRVLEVSADGDGYRGENQLGGFDYRKATDAADVNG